MVCFSVLCCTEPKFLFQFKAKYFLLSNKNSTSYAMETTRQIFQYFQDEPKSAGQKIRAHIFLEILKKGNCYLRLNICFAGFETQCIQYNEFFTLKMTRYCKDIFICAISVVSVPYLSICWAWTARSTLQMWLSEHK